MIQDNGRKVFRTSSAPPERVEFDLIVLHNRTGQEATHSFDIPGRLSAGAQLWLAQFAPDEQGNSTVDALAIMGFFQRAMPAPEFARFVRIVDDPELSVEIQALAEVLDYVVEKITGRPTGLRSSSSGGPQFNGGSWMAPPSSTAPTSSPSPQPAT